MGFFQLLEKYFFIQENKKTIVRITHLLFTKTNHLNKKKISREKKIKTKKGSFIVKNIFTKVSWVIFVPGISFFFFPLADCAAWLA